MHLRVREFRYTVCHSQKSRTVVLTKEECLPISLGYLEFHGVRDSFPYNKLIFIKNIKDNEIEIVMLNEVEKMRAIINLTLNNEETFVHKGPKGLPYGYYYKLMLEEDDNEK